MTLICCVSLSLNLYLRLGDLSGVKTQQQTHLGQEVSGEVVSLAEL